MEILFLPLIKFKFARKKRSKKAVLSAFSRARRSAISFAQCLMKNTSLMLTEVFKVARRERFPNPFGKITCFWPFQIKP